MYFHYSCTPTVPDQVTNLAVQPSVLSNGLISLTVTWGEPHSDVDITRYEGTYRILPSGSPEGGFSQGPTNRRRVFSNLMSGVNYEVRVRARSPIGAGEYRSVTTTCMPVCVCVCVCVHACVRVRACMRACVCA